MINDGFKRSAVKFLYELPHKKKKYESFTWSRLPLQKKGVQNTSYSHLLSCWCCVAAARWAVTGVPPPPRHRRLERQTPVRSHHPLPTFLTTILPFLQEYLHTCCLLELEYCPSHSDNRRNKERCLQFGKRLCLHVLFHSPLRSQFTVSMLSREST